MATGVRTQIRAEREGFSAGGTPTLRQIYGQLQRVNETQAEDIRELRKKIAQYEESARSRRGSEKPAAEELARLRLWAGLVPIQGPGVIVTLVDSPNSPPLGMDRRDWPEGQVHDTDIRSVINELWLSGAEAVSVNGHRVLGRTGIRCVGPTVHVTGLPVAPPYVIKAIGSPQDLVGGLDMPGGILDELRGLNMVTVDRVDLPEEITIVAFSGGSQMILGHIPLPEPEPEDEGQTLP